MGEVLAIFTVDQVTRLTGVSRATLLAWDAFGLFSPEFATQMQQGAFGKIYSFQDLVAVKTLEVLRKVYRVPKAELKETAENLRRFASKPWSELTLYVLNKEVHFKQPDGEVVGALSGQKAIPIPLRSVVQEMREAALKLRQRNNDQLGATERHRLVASNQEVFAGTRIPVSLIMSLLRSGESEAALLVDYPTLKSVDIALAKQRLTVETTAA
jgi:DNA-binding transcriptional MerR regulator